MVTATIVETVCSVFHTHRQLEIFTTTVGTVHEVLFLSRLLHRNDCSQCRKGMQWVFMPIDSCMEVFATIVRTIHKVEQYTVVCINK